MDKRIRLLLFFVFLIMVVFGLMISYNMGGYNTCKLSGGTLLRESGNCINLSSLYYCLDEDGRIWHQNNDYPKIQDLNINWSAVR